MALATTSGAASWSLRRAAWISAARSSMRRLRPPRRRAEAIMDSDRLRPREGVEATASTATASAPWRSSKQVRAPG